VLCVTACRAAFGDRAARVGEQPVTWGPTRLWVLPNPSGLNAHWSAAALADELRRLGDVAGVTRPDPARDVGSAPSTGS
jgi:TDG/mug DNA glycosylase family protein